jgi:hypothetical protein
VADERRWHLSCGYEGETSNEPWWFDAWGPIIPKYQEVVVCPESELDAERSRLDSLIKGLEDYEAKFNVTAADTTDPTIRRLAEVGARDIQKLIEEARNG